MDMTGGSDEVDDIEGDVLGAPPALPDDIWERLLSAAFAAPEGAGAELIPDDDGSDALSGVADPGGFDPALDGTDRDAPGSGLDAPDVGENHAAAHDADHDDHQDASHTGGDHDDFAGDESTAGHELPPPAGPDVLG